MKGSLIKYICYLSILLFFNLQAADANQYHYTILPKQDWVNEPINALYKETDKFLWIGTNKGVYKYNGNEFFLYKKGNSETVHEKFTHKIFYDNKHHLYILTASGLGVYNQAKDEFEFALPGSKYQYTAFFSVCQLEQGILLGGTEDIVFYDYTTNKVTPIYSIPQESKQYKIKCIYKISDHEIIYSIADRIERLNLINKQLSSIQCPSTISSLTVDNDNRIWVGCYHKGLYQVNIKDYSITPVTAYNDKYYQDPILCMEKSDSLLWIGTDGGGMNILNLKDFTIQKLQHIMGQSQSFPSNVIKSLHWNKDGTMWAGSIRYGVIAIRKTNIKSYAEVPNNNPYGPIYPTILSFHESITPNEVWIGTDGGGIDKFNLKPRTFTHYPSTKGMKVVSVCDYDNQHLLLSLYQNGLKLFNKSTGETQPFHLKDKALESKVLFSTKCLRLEQESPTSILILIDRVYRLDLRTNEIKCIASKYNSEDGEFIYAGIYQKSIILHNHKKIYALERGSDTLRNIIRVPNGEFINSVTTDPSGRIWVGSNRGLSYVDINQAEQHLVPSKLFTDVSLVFADHQGRVWLASGKKLFTYVIANQSFVLLGESDGVIPTVFLKKSCLRTRQNDIFLGGIEGFVMIDHAYQMDKINPAVVNLLSFQIDDQTIMTSKLGKIPSVEVGCDSKSVNFKVETFGDDILRPKIYKYEIKGANEQTVITDSPVFEFNSFVPGKSEVFVACGTREGTWGETLKLAEIKFLAPWYQSVWFYLFMFVLLTLILFIRLKSFIRRAEQKLKFKLKEREKEMYAEKVNFLININHELRTPLTLINGPLQRMLKNMPSSSNQYATLYKIYKQTDRMKNLLNMVLDLRKMEEGESTLNIQPHQVNQWIKNIVDNFTFSDDNYKITIHTELSDDIPLVPFDQAKCEIVITNFLANAIKHSPAESVIKVKSEITPSNRLRISVTDNGPGIQNTNPALLFKRFYQGEDESQGSGIGLSYSKLLIDLHHGTIGAENNTDTTGATFYFEISLNLKTGKMECESKPYINDLFTSSNPTSKSQVVEQSTKYITTQKTLLVVDDNSELTDFIKESYQNKFKEILVAHNGQMAYQMTCDKLPDVIISDVMMPKMDGFELCKHIKSNLKTSHIPLILLTARNETQGKLHGYKMGADAYIPKPFDTDILYEIINSQLLIRENIKQKYLQHSVLVEPQTDTFSQIDEDFLLKLNKIITDNIQNSELDIPFVCNEIGMSKASLYNKLKALTDMSCNEYINKIKLERAITLVKSTNKNFTEIADETGFSNSKYFSTCFKQYTGLTPTQYRKENKGEN